ncbi:hypothetical protein ACQPUQ_03125 [Clostridium paraputrificum]|uniref:hypothetical protein n=1 Tax=Clostridium paraputrificum TaxID=29363 RepID=UPI003D34C967
MTIERVFGDANLEKIFESIFLCEFNKNLHNFLKEEEEEYSIENKNISDYTEEHKIDCVAQNKGGTQ